ncbi:MAG: hypothetical protein HY787_08655 [Deltaproteobacteria bacterium]|nr:hypothetical protein [Deltaproteobacteria bacterium]
MSILIVKSDGDKVYYKVEMGKGETWITELGQKEIRALKLKRLKNYPIVCRCDGRTDLYLAPEGNEFLALIRREIPGDEETEPERVSKLDELSAQHEAWLKTDRIGNWRLDMENLTLVNEACSYKIDLEMIRTDTQLLDWILFLAEKPGPQWQLENFLCLLEIAAARRFDKVSLRTLFCDRSRPLIHW